MSVKSASRFLCAVSQDQRLRDQFVDVQSPNDFVRISSRLGYTFTSTDLKTVISQYSNGVLLRRRTGVWKWLRDVRWM